MEFRCHECQLIFESGGTRVEYRDPFYGPCSKVVAPCPQCGSESSEFRKPKPVKAASKSAGSPAENCPAYHGGTCGCCH